MKSARFTRCQCATGRSRCLGVHRDVFRRFFNVRTGTTCVRDGQEKEWKQTRLTLVAAPSLGMLPVPRPTPLVPMATAAVCSEKPNSALQPERIVGCKAMKACFPTLGSSTLQNNMVSGHRG